MMGTTAHSIAARYARLGVLEIPGPDDHPFIQWCHSLCGLGLDTPDEVPWCSSFAQHPAFELDLPRSKSARARSWLNVGIPTNLEDAERGFDIVVLARGEGPQPGPEVMMAPGHVGYFDSWNENGDPIILGGNQSNSVSFSSYRRDRILSIRRLI
jgi:uncharacterized protein (TIGR02594 family)